MFTATFSTVAKMRKEPQSHRRERTKMRSGRDAIVHKRSVAAATTWAQAGATVLRNQSVRGRQGPWEPTTQTGRADAAVELSGTASRPAGQLPAARGCPHLSPARAQADPRRRHSPAQHRRRGVWPSCAPGSGKRRRGHWGPASPSLSAPTSVSAPCPPSRGPPLRDQPSGRCCGGAGPGQTVRRPAVLLGRTTELCPDMVSLTVCPRPQPTVNPPNKHTHAHGNTHGRTWRYTHTLHTHTETDTCTHTCAHTHTHTRTSM